MIVDLKVFEINKRRALQKMFADENRIDYEKFVEREWEQLKSLELDL